MSKSKSPAPSIATPPAPSHWLSKPQWQGLLVAFIGILLYTNTLSHGFVLDDRMIITGNKYVQQGISGWSEIFTTDAFQGFYGDQMDQVQVQGGRYRPLSLAVFAVVYQVAGNNSLVFHLLSVLLYGLTCWLVYDLTRRLLARDATNPTLVWVPLATALLYAAHPVHTEVVNNIKSADEIWCMLLSLLTLRQLLRAWDSQQISRAWVAGLIFLLACLAKENAVTLVLLLPLALWIFRGATSFSTLRRFCLPIWLAFILFFLLRTAVLGFKFGAAPLDLINNPFVKFDGVQWQHFSFGEKLASVIFILGKYLQLLVFPHPLSSDYYPRQVGIMDFSHPGVWVSLAAYTFIIWYALRSVLKGRKEVAPYGILFFVLGILLVSNLVFPIGTNLAERFLFMPSYGFCLALSYLLIEKIPSRQVAFGILGLILILFGVKTWQRNPAYASNLTLFTTDVKTSSNSAKIQNGTAALLCEAATQQNDPAQRTATLTTALVHANRALEIHPTYPEAFYNRGSIALMMNNLEAAVSDYGRSYALNQQYPGLSNNYAYALRELAKKNIQSPQPDWNKAIQQLKTSYSLYGKDQETIQLIANIYQMLNQPEEAAKWNSLLPR
jgi:protein O-mannosyl-transferase